ncbi:hypothetical protein GCM10020295_43640 [Streptomyces cinereospinus]
MSDDEKNPARKVITDYAQSHFRYFRTVDGTVYAQRTGHPVARPIRSQGTTGSHRQELMVGLFRDGVGVFNGTALKEALDLIEALALTEKVQPTHIRVAPGFDGATWLDLGRDDGRSVRIHPTGWDIRIPDPEEVCWRRTQLTGELPVPAKDTNGKGIDLLMRLCNFADAKTEALAIAWLIGCLEPSVPVPAPFLTGPQGAGKSTGGRMLVRIIEGMTGDLRRAPKDEENMITAVAAGWITALDNLSHLPPGPVRPDVLRHHRSREHQARPVHRRRRGPLPLPAPDAADRYRRRCDPPRPRRTAPHPAPGTPPGAAHRGGAVGRVRRDPARRPRLPARPDREGPRSAGRDSYRSADGGLCAPVRAARRGHRLRDAGGVPGQPGRPQRRRH